MTVMPGEVHHFFNPDKSDEEVVMKVKLQPAREGFEKGLYILYGLARDGKSGDGGRPNSLMDAAVICSMADMWGAGIVGTILIPVLKVLAFFARRNGVEERLVQQYWA